ncbi:Protein kinase C and casein kinase substrate in neurons protein 1 [Goodea atripinnis]|uniref:Protein kinase C and casein kinase substrate in neurons protein 1 n=1 Tax=Goodea atripinnis TaxID=208336 RepID=A0ABV0MVS7_9TELE
MAMMTEAEKVSDLHTEMKNHLMSEDFEKVKNWQKDSYHKQMMGGFKETKEADEGFKKAQKPWAKKLKEVEVAKKSYHMACKEEKLAVTREANNKGEATTPAEQRKLQDKLEKCKQDSQKEYNPDLIHTISKREKSKKVNDEVMLTNVKTPRGIVQVEDRGRLKSDLYSF